ncbi:MAG: sigma-70 family RNA polymerase sigma factor [Christensenellaceae bacterium]|jgi:RNA polymerase sigma-70 factor (ECF subfamily)
MDEKALIKKAQEGEIEAFETLMQNYQGKIFALALRMTRNPEDAYDVAQESMIKIYRAIKKFKGKSAFGTWVYAITRNAALDYLRKRSRKTSHEQELPEYADLQLATEESSLPEAQAEQRETRDYLLKLIDELPEVQKRAIILREIDGYSYEEIAEILQISLGTVKSRLFRAREALRDKITERKAS